jgi:pimeloyl-[acyl-carrier protein] methyl ester esterase
MTTLVLLPGMDGTGLLFDPLVKALSGTLPFTVVAYPPTAPAGYADLQAFAESAMPSDESIVLLGESFSGPIAIALAAKYPKRVKAVILCCTFARCPRPFLAPLRSLAAWAPIKQLPMAIACAALLGRHATTELRCALNAALSKVSASALRERLKAVLSVDVSAELARLAVPILNLRASDDLLVPKHAGDFNSRAQQNRMARILSGPHCPCGPLG